jgi:hypothetical protein
MLINDESRLKAQISLFYRINISQKEKLGRAGGVAQVGEHLLSKCKALSLNPSVTKKKK